MRSVYFSFIFLLILSSCSSVYIPPSKNVPLFEKKGEVQIESGLSTNSIFATGSYAFSEKYALIANGNLSFRNFSPFYDLSDILRRSDYSLIWMFNEKLACRSFESGLGRYNLLTSSSKWRLETFAGAMYGESRSDWHFQNKHLQGFFQVNIGKRSQYDEIGWSSRIAYSHFSSEQEWGTDIIYANFNAFHIENLFFLRFGGEHFKVILRYGFNLVYPSSFYSSFKNFSIDRGYSILHFSVGLTYRFPKT